MISAISNIVRYWWPPPVDIAAIAERLSRFYAERSDYHAMTASEDRADHPQVRALLEMLDPSYFTVEFGCGGGVVLDAVSRRVRRALGMDVSPIALRRAATRSPKAVLAGADAARAPLRDGCADFSYCFEMLEHVWDPEAVIREMIRVVRPGGRVFFTTPNGYSLDLHLKLRASVRWINLAAARAVLHSGRAGRIYQNIPPNLDAMPVYPDCDMITRIHPADLAAFAEKHGCETLRLETFFFQQHKAPSEAERQRYAQLDRHPFYRYYGDHIFFLGRKR